MCGICGYIGDDRPELLPVMSASMTHRGPDDAGEWYDRELRVGLGHRRLSIIDLSSAAHQPMTNEDGSIYISFNGEIYDYARLRAGLISRGHTFRSNSDTEVLIHLYEERGIDFLSDLNGIFAFALWDGKNRQLILARDHAGVKPLYYWTRGERLFFASEIKALLRCGECPRELNLNALPSYLTFLWIPGEETLLAEIKKLEPGHYLLWKDGQFSVRRWFSLPYQPDLTASADEWFERVHECLLATMKRQMVSDVPLGAFLSGGLDSSSLVAYMRALHPADEITCYTARAHPADSVRESFEDDFPFARQVAQRLGVTLQHFDIESNIMSLLPKMVYHLDEPDADPAVLLTYLISRFARRHGTTVLISGTGGDEVFFGYRSHQAYQYFHNLEKIPSWITAPFFSLTQGLLTAFTGAQSPPSRRMNKFHRALNATGVIRHLALVDWSGPQTRQELCTANLQVALKSSPGAAPVIERYFNAFQGIGELNRHSFILIQTFLAAHNFLYTDKTSMAASVEVRVPFMDIELLRLAASIPEALQLEGGETKHILKGAVRQFLPPAILSRNKAGFGAPLRKWIADDLRPLIETLLDESTLTRRGLFNPKSVQHFIKENQLNRADHGYLIYALLNLEIWQQTFIDRPAEEVTV